MSTLGKRKRQLVTNEETQLRNKIMRSMPGAALKIQASRDAAILRQVKSRPLQRNGNLKQETNYVDLVVATYAMDTTGSITLIATVAQGASVSQRIGKKIRWESIQCRGLATSNATTAIADGAWLLVYDKRPTGSLPAITDILITANSNALNNDNNSGRFQILRRLNYVFTGNSTTPATGKEAYDVSEFVNVKRPCIFKSAATGAIGDIEEGALYLVTVGNQAAGAAACKVDVAFRVRYRDM